MSEVFARQVASVSAGRMPGPGEAYDHCSECDIEVICKPGVAQPICRPCIKRMIDEGAEFISVRRAEEH